MALTKTFEFAGITVPNGYLRVGYVGGNKKRMSFVLCYQASANDGCVKRANYEFVPSMNSDNFIKQAYEYLKTLPEFADATDV